MESESENGSQQLKLIWDNNTDTNVVNYNIFIGFASRSYHTNFEISANTNSISFDNLETNRTYYFALTAKDFENIESDYSDEVSYTTP